jgi:hypothetical protein
VKGEKEAASCNGWRCTFFHLSPQQRVWKKKMADVEKIGVSMEENGKITEGLAWWGGGGGEVGICMNVYLEADV